jgi:uncharacterized protein YdhG (YjbR/CyaY superfamily)
MSSSEVDDYIAGFPADVREILAKVRGAIHASVPGGEEKIRYGMPAIMLGGRYAIHFAGWKKHVGIYPVAVLSPEIEAELAPYRAAKDSLNFVYAKPVPYDLIERVAAALYAKHTS